MHLKRIKLGYWATAKEVKDYRITPKNNSENGVRDTSTGAADRQAVEP